MPTPLTWKKHPPLCQIRSTPLSVSHSPSSLHLCTSALQAPPPPTHTHTHTDTHTHNTLAFLKQATAGETFLQANEREANHRHTLRNVVMIIISQLLVGAKYCDGPLKKKKEKREGSLLSTVGEICIVYSSNRSASEKT